MSNYRQQRIKNDGKHCCDDLFFNVDRQRLLYQNAIHRRNHHYSELQTSDFIKVNDWRKL